MAELQLHRGQLVSLVRWWVVQGPLGAGRATLIKWLVEAGSRQGPDPNPATVGASSSNSSVLTTESTLGQVSDNCWQCMKCLEPRLPCAEQALLPCFCLQDKVCVRCSFLSPSSLPSGPASLCRAGTIGLHDVK
jgi:hypothetical protein